MLKVGDEVVVKYEMILVAYNVREHTITLQLLSNNSRPIDEITLPMYIGELQMFLPAMDYAYPGPYLPDKHPDHYPQHPKDAGTVLYKGQSYTIKPDVDFLLNGKYRLIPLDGKKASVITKQAQLLTEQARIESLKEIMSENYLFTKGSLKGTIVYFIVKSSSGELEKLLPENIEVRTDTSRSNIYAYIQDPITYVQYGINAHYLELNKIK